MNKGLFFMTLSLICFWLVLDQFYGDQRIKNIVSSLVDNDTVKTKTETTDTGRNYKKVLNDDGTESGYIYYERPGGLGASWYDIYKNGKKIESIRGYKNLLEKLKELEGETK